MKSPEVARAMDVRLHIYLEATPSGVVWWSESPDVPGFHATDLRLQHLIQRSEVAIFEILGEVVRVVPTLVGEPPDSVGDQPADRRIDDARAPSLGTIASSVVGTPAAA